MYLMDLGHHKHEVRKPYYESRGENDQWIFSRRIAQDIFWKIDKNNFLLQDTLEQLQCVKCER